MRDRVKQGPIVHHTAFFIIKLPVPPILRDRVHSFASNLNNAVRKHRKIRLI
jgi:hypothetical protein